MVAMVVVLRPGLPPTPPIDRYRFFQEHALELPGAWRLSWILWMVTTVAMFFFYISLHRAMETGWRGWLAVVLALLGMGADGMGDHLFLSEYPDTLNLLRYDDLDRETAFLSGGLANGAYTLAWILLLVRAPFPRGFLALAIPGVAGGLLLALSGFAGWTPGLMAGTAVAIPAFTLWTGLVGRFFWKKSEDAVTMSPHV